jgi:hypothetical protein
MQFNRRCSTLKLFPSEAEIERRGLLRRLGARHAQAEPASIHRHDKETKKCSI